VMSSAPASDAPKPASKLVSFFGDFNKKTSAFWDVDNYKLGHQYEINIAPTEKSNVRVKVKDDASLTTSVKTNFDTQWGKFELVEDSKKGLSVGLNVDHFCRQWNLKTTHSAQEVEATAECRPEGSFWATELTGKYKPDEEGDRVCNSIFSIAVHDSQYNLAVGGKLELEDRRQRGSSLQYANLLKTYAMGFLYSPTDSTQYSLIYKPDKESNGVNYDFSLFKKVSEQFSVAGRAEGKADLRIVSPPLLSLGAAWCNNGNLLRGFFNTRKEYGASYQVKMTPNVSVTLGLASFLSEDDLETTLGFKVSLS